MIERRIGAVVGALLTVFFIGLRHTGAEKTSGWSGVGGWQSARFLIASKFSFPIRQTCRA